ncbi:MAG: hypothetical protein WBG92_14070 [Thiohalocapsa sp.]
MAPRKWQVSTDGSVASGRSLTRLVLRLSVWLLIVLCAWQALRHIAMADQILSDEGPFGLRTLLWPFVVLGLELILWLRWLRPRRAPGRLFAGLMGAYLLLGVVLVNLVFADMHDHDISAGLLWLYGLIGTAHLWYAIAGSEHG